MGHGRDAVRRARCASDPGNGTVRKLAFVGLWVRVLQHWCWHSTCGVFLSEFWVRRTHVHARSLWAMAAPVSHRALVSRGWACAGTWDVCQHTHWRDVASAAWRDSGSLFESFSLHGGFSMCAIYTRIGATCVSWPREPTGSCGDRMCRVRCVDIISIPQLRSPGAHRRVRSFSPQKSGGTSHLLPREAVFSERH